MTDTRTRIIEALREVLNESTRRAPEQIAVNIPLGKLADAAMEAVADGETVPTIPIYDSEITPKRRWSSPRSQADFESGGEFHGVGVEPAADGGVDIVIEGGDWQEEVTLPLADATEFFLTGLAAVAAQQRKE